MPSHYFSSNYDLTLAVEKEDRWISHAISAINHEASVPLTWSAYHASSMSSEFALPAVCTMLPLFYEKAATPAMVKHGMTIQQQATAFLNKGQIPVSFFDFSMQWPSMFDGLGQTTTVIEQNHVVMMGGLHSVDVSDRTFSGMPTAGEMWLQRNLHQLLMLESSQSCGAHLCINALVKLLQ